MTTDNDTILTDINSPETTKLTEEEHPLDPVEQMRQRLQSGQISTTNAAQVKGESLQVKINVKREPKPIRTKLTRGIILFLAFFLAVEIAWGQLSPPPPQELAGNNGPISATEAATQLGDDLADAPPEPFYPDGVRRAILPDPYDDIFLPSEGSVSTSIGQTK